MDTVNQHDDDMTSSKVRVISSARLLWVALDVNGSGLAFVEPGERYTQSV